MSAQEQQNDEEAKRAPISLPPASPPSFKQVTLIPDATGGPYKVRTRSFEFADAVATDNEKRVAKELECSAAFWVEGGVQTVSDPSGGQAEMHMEIERGTATQLWFYDPAQSDKSADNFVAVLGLCSESNDDLDNKYVFGKSVVELRAPSYPIEADDPHRPISLLIFRSGGVAHEPIGATVASLASVAAALFFRRLERI